MSPLLIFAIAVVVLVVLIAAEVPVGYALTAAGTVGLVLMDGPGFAGATLSSRPYAAVASFSYILIPMFMLMSMFIMQANVVESLFEVASRTLGRMPGGLGLAAVAGCAGFAAVTGSSVATVATMGRVAIGQMRDHGDSLPFAAGIIASTGTLGILIPPSLVLVIYAILAGESVGAMLMAGVIPGAISAVIYGLVVVIWAKNGGVQRPVDDILESAARGPSWQGILAVAQIGILGVVVIGGIYSGIFTATESGAVAAFIAFIMLFVSVRGGAAAKVRALRESFKETSATAGMIFMLLVGGSIFTFFMVNADIPETIASGLADAALPPFVILLLMLLFLVPMGMFLDGFSILLITVPLLVPTVQELGYDVIWFGILMTKMIEFGLITPPLGINVYVVAGTTADLSVEQSFRGIWPFAVADVATISLLVAVPALVLWLPSQIAI